MFVETQTVVLGFAKLTPTYGLAFYWPVQNDVQRVGIPQFDISNLFGSAGEAKAFNRSNSRG